MNKTKEYNLAVIYPEISSQWNYTKNENLIPEDFLPKSSKKVWWICDKMHEYDMKVSDRTSNGSSCPYCSNQRACIDNCLATLFPLIAEEWDNDRNDGLTPFDVTYGSGKKVWWKCSNGHIYNTSPHTRVSGKTGCPYCSNKKVCEDNCLGNLFPSLIKEWHPIKNNNLTPFDVTFGSDKKVWWICEFEHEWESKIYDRSKKEGANCPYCCGLYPSNDNNLFILFPEISSEFHPTKNGNLTPSNLTSKSSKKVWWFGECGHEYCATISSRTTRGSGCPYCKNKKVCIDNCLETTHPELSKEWNHSKNKITPLEVTAGSDKKIWWICKNNHEWETIVCSRTGRLKTGCPYCFGRIACYENCLSTLFPELSQEWNYEKNGKLTPSDVSKCSNKKVWWKCKLGHEWQTAVANRANSGTGCPECYLENNIGENHSRYNHSLTDEYREKSRLYTEYSVWRSSVYERDNYTCQCCGLNISGTLNAHHKDGYHWCVDRRVDINNGATLCEACHIDFHLIYGFRDNTEDQYDEWLNEAKEEILSNELKKLNIDIAM